MKRIANSITDLVGNTPLVKLNRIVPKGSANIYAKLEVFNPGGSVKDRISLNMIEQAEKSGILKEGATIIEATSGNTGIGLAMVGAARGYKVVLVMPDSMSVERIHILKSYGAKLVLTPADEGMRGAVDKARELIGQTESAFMPSQFTNPDNPSAHRKTTAKEILNDTEGEIDAFVAGVGTGGTITGVAEVLKKHNAQIHIVAIEPEASPVLSGGDAGGHLIQGIGAGFVPEILNRAIVDEIIKVSDQNAFDVSRQVCRLEGINAGISCGAALWGALQVAKRLGEGKNIVVIFPDSGERYLSVAEFMED
ncbi:MAG: cysteine synthase A [Candidatus Omnitrophota bacterium]|jgi:cysteine synthase A